MKAVKRGFAQRFADQNSAPEVVAVVKELLAPRRHRVSKMVSASDALEDFRRYHPHRQGL